MPDSVMHSIQNLHLLESTIDEETSYAFLRVYLSNNDTYHKYKYPDISIYDMTTLISNFSSFCGKIKDQKSNKLYASTIPLGVFRFILLSDGSWSHYYTVKPKSGYVVEGVAWSNGMFYQVRENKKEDFEIYEIVLLLDSLTKVMYNFP